MFSRIKRSVAVLSLLSAVFFAGSASAQEQGVVSSFTGTISHELQEDVIALTIDGTQYTVGDRGRVGLVLVMSAEDDVLDPGLISVAPDGSGSVKSEMRRPDIAGSKSSIALADLSPGVFAITVRSEHKTAGDYRVDVFLAGDANRDYRVDADDLALISSLAGTQHGEEVYSAQADVDRNGVINGGDRQRAESNVGAAAPAPVNEELNPLDVSLPMGALALVNGSTETFVGRNGLSWSLTGAAFDATPGDTTLTINGNPVPASAFVITDHLLTANVTLVDGRNEIRLKAYDTEGRPLYYNETLWAGTFNLTVRLLNKNGTAFLNPATVLITLSDDTSVSVERTATNGSVTFTNIPARTVLIKAKGSGNELGTAGVVGTSSSVNVIMEGYDAPSGIQNNDFSLGTAGWDVGTAPVAIVPHQEVIAAVAPGVSSLATFPATSALVDQDLMLGTAGEGLQSISRTFTTAADTTAVRVRYRFITSEVPGGYYGSRYNDYFRVAIRTQAGGGFAGETTAMNSLPLGAYTGGGSTDWREATLLVDAAGDTIQVDIGVANVADGALDSQVVVDFVEEIKDEVRPTLAWNNTAGGLTLRWQVMNRALTDPVTINVHFANGTGQGNALGAAVFTHTVPAGTQPGPGGPVNVAGNLLADDPNGTTHMIAIAGESQVGSVRDVRIAYGPNANGGVVSAGMTDIVKDGLRAAGASVGNVTSTLRSQEDQARAMFNNLVNPARTVAQNVQRQLALYGRGGDMVINRFVAETQGMTRDAIVAAAANVRAAMVDEMNDIAPIRVSNHIGDPAQRTVIDVGYSSFTGGNGGLFRTSTSPRLDVFLNEPENSCYHLELEN